MKPHPLKMPNRLRCRKLHIRTRSRNTRHGLGYQHYYALWRAASIPKRKRRAERALQWLSRNMLMQTDPGAYYQCPAGRLWGEE